MTVVIDIMHTTMLFTVDLPSLKVSVQLFCINIEIIDESMVNTYVPSYYT